MYKTEFRTEIPEFLKQLNAWRKRIAPQERRCIQEKMIEIATEAAIREALRVSGGTNPLSVKRAIQSQLGNTQLRGDGGKFTSAFGRIFINIEPDNRTSQVLAMMVTGGRVEIGSSRMVAMTITRRYSVKQTRQIMSEVYRSGKRIQSPNGNVTYYAPKAGGRNFSLVEMADGRALFERSGPWHHATRQTGTVGGNPDNEELIAWFPKTATYKSNQFKFTAVINQAIEQNLIRIQEECFRKNTGQKFRKGNRIRGAF